ncbi:TadE/TadG family type IV pilus assembly protein [Novosphingobium sp. B1]|uniref:TadE/TadG family type IV pilus assembly protein n=1 Tax=Novosphingobium sp. B1 TaxID=1938756 RepID=UPI0009D88E08|nr:hypothetical protein [Novosphingobium sp. B1]SMC31247.1 hypothetical protein SAMN06272759_101351 [Novosphingobium sp. B1]
MTIGRRFRCGLRADITGVMAIETAVIAPVMVLFSLGAYQVSSLVARQGEIQSAMTVAESVALATEPDTSAKRDTLKGIVAASTGLPQSQIVVEAAYRCNASTTFVTLESTCLTGANVSRYIRVKITDSYVPLWTEFGVGSTIALSAERYILYSQGTKK